MKFNISYIKNEVYQTILINANAAEVAEAYFKTLKPDAEVLGTSEAKSHDMRPGKPEMFVPNDFITEYTREQNELVEGAEVITFNNARSESIQIDLRHVETEPDNSTGLMNRWHKAGLIKKKLPNYISIDTYATDLKGDCKAYYNPSHKMHESGTRCVLDFNWILQDTPENRSKIISQIIQLSNGIAWTGPLRNELI